MAEGLIGLLPPKNRLVVAGARVVISSSVWGVVVNSRTFVRVLLIVGLVGLGRKNGVRVRMVTACCSSASVVVNGAAIVVERNLCLTLPVVGTGVSSTNTGLRLGLLSRTGGTRLGLLDNSVAGVSLFNGLRSLFLLFVWLSRLFDSSG